ncbi:MAG: hypothetical protein KG029_07985 [Bacteroidetes bacterium]|jgi:hypothetical protein|nr:hypothetical protein [Bacteroidota bacterium]
MKKSGIIFILTIILLPATLFSQSKKWYPTSSGEIIFSAASIESNGNEGESVIRFSPVFNSQNHINRDFGDYFGMFSGLNVRNVGFIFKDEAGSGRTKYRTYNLGIPIGVKLGNLKENFLYGGYEIEFPFNYKEKRFVNEKKTEKFSVWFSKRVPTYYHSFILGLELKSGINFKLKYYLTSFFNKDFVEDVGGQPVKIYENFDVNVLYFSLSFDMFKAFNQSKQITRTEEVMY